MRAGNVQLRRAHIKPEVVDPSALAIRNGVNLTPAISAVEALTTWNRRGIFTTASNKLCPASVATLQQLDQTHHLVA